MTRFPRLLSLAVSAVLALSSCATYTVQDGYDAIVLPPPPSGRPETRYRIILEENEKKSAEAIENAKKEAEHRALLRRDAEVNEYPDDLSLIDFPHVYTPLRSNATKSDGIVTAQILFLPLGYDEISQEETERILASVSDISPDFAVLTGSLENQVTGARTAGWDAVTLEGGTILHRPLLKEADASSAVFFITPTRDIAIAPIGFDSSIPSAAEDVPAWLEAIESTGSEKAEIVMAAAGAMKDDEKLLVISSSEPATADWEGITPFRYRSEKHFAVSDALSDASWLDVYRSTHFTAETDGGITRKNGEIYERMDFIYSYDMIPLDAISFPVAGLTDRTGTFAVLATVLIP